MGCEIEETNIDSNSRQYQNCFGEKVTNGVCNQSDCRWKIKAYLSLLWYLEESSNWTIIRLIFQPGDVYWRTDGVVWDYILYALR